MAASLGRYVFAIAALCLVAFPAPRIGAVPILEASLGFGGYSVPGRWTPLWIRCPEAPRSATIQVLRLDAEGKETGRESFPSGGPGVECPVRLSGDLGSLVVRLAAGSRVLAEIEVLRTSRSFPGHLVLACGLDVADRQYVSGALMPGEPMVVVSTRYAGLPANGLDYDGISAVAIAEAGEAKRSGTGGLLSPAQRSSFLAWLAGGGHLVVLADPVGPSRLLEELDIPTPLPTDGLSGRDFGFGRYALLRNDEARSVRTWRDALALRPYDATFRIGGSAALRGDSDLASISAGRTNGTVYAALAAWLAAVASAVFLGRRRLAPVALVAASCLAAVVVGGGAIDRSFARGARGGVSILALPEVPSAFATFRAEPYAAGDPFSWLGGEVIGRVSVRHSDGESGSFGAWNHRFPAASFSPAGSGALSLSALLPTDRWRRLLPVSPVSPTEPAGRADQASPPPFESRRPLAYRPSGQSGTWWIKDSESNWLRAGRVPPWLAGYEERISALQRERPDAAVLAGTIPASLVGFTVQGAPPQGSAVWIMAFPGGGTE